MTPARRADPDSELDSLIWEITVDRRDEDEQLAFGFETAFPTRPDASRLLADYGRWIGT